MMNLEGKCLCGAVGWSYSAPLESATACNCSACRRYGTLWAYGYIGKEIELVGEAKAFGRGDSLTFQFCPTCGSVSQWVANKADEEGRVRAAVNLRLVIDAETIQHLLIDHFDGFVNFEDLPRDGKCIRDLWF